jgi:Ureidoglycolate hydrolase
MKTIQAISREAFKKFGYVIEFSPDCAEHFEILAVEPDNPWRIAVFRYTNRSTKIIENHPYSMESFEPLQGLTLLLVAENGKPEDYEAFILDKPVCLFKGVWHQVLALTGEASVKITENKDVVSEFHNFEKAIQAIVC